MEKPDPRFVVPEFARGYHVDDLPLLPTTRAALKRLGLRKLGEAHGLVLWKLGGRPDSLGERIADLALAISGLREGEPPAGRDAEAWVRRAVSGPPRDVFEMIDAALDRLDRDRRELLLLRFGADGGAPLTESETAKRLGMGTRQNVQQRQRTALKHVWQAAGPEFRKALRTIGDDAAAGKESLDYLLKRTFSARRRRYYASAFYLRVLCKLAPGLRG